MQLKTKKNVLLVLLIIFIFVISSILLVKNQMGYVSNPTVTNTNTSVWPKYSYEKIWQMQYPPDWNVLPDQNGGGVSFTSLGFEQDSEDMAPYGNGGKVSYSVFGEYDLFDKNIKTGDQFPNGDRTMMQKIQSVKNITVDSYPANYYVYAPENNANFLKRRVAIFKDDKVYRFNAVFAKEESVKLFDTMIQTFKFY